MYGFFNRSWGRAASSFVRIPDLAASCVRILLRIRKPLPFLWCYILRKPLPARVVEFRDGTRIFVEHPDDLATINLIFFRATYSGMSQNDVVLDVGANIGTFALYAVRHAGARKVYAFEPCTESFRLLRRNIEANGLTGVIVPFQNAVCHSRRGKSVDFPVSSSPSNNMRNDDADQTNPVETTTLDEIIEKHGLERIQYVKLDCEGAEYEILEELSRANYERIDQFTIEYHEGREAELVSRIEERGLRLRASTKVNANVGMLNFRRPDAAGEAALAGAAAAVRRVTGA